MFDLKYSKALSWTLGNSIEGEGGKMKREWKREKISSKRGKKCLKIVSFWVVNVKTLSSFVRCGKEESQMGEWE